MLIIMILSRKEFCRSLPQMRGLCSGLIWWLTTTEKRRRRKHCLIYACNPFILYCSQEISFKADLLRRYLKFKNMSLIKTSKILQILLGGLNNSKGRSIKIRIIISEKMLCW
jgi:hypothetical protein